MLPGGVTVEVLVAVLVLVWVLAGVLVLVMVAVEANEVGVLVTVGVAVLTNAATGTDKLRVQLTTAATKSRASVLNIAFV